MFSEAQREELISRARARPEDETLVTRTLREYFEKSCLDSTIVDRIKNGVTIFVDLSTGTPSGFSHLSGYVSDAIFRALGLSNPPIGVADACRTASQLLGGRPVLLVFDEIGKLADPCFRHMLIDVNADSTKETICNEAMSALRDVIDKVRGVDKVAGNLTWMVYCTGRTRWLAMHTLSGPSSPLRAEGVLLSALDAEDVQAMMGGNPKLSPLHDEPAKLRYLAEEIARRSGGVGRVIVGALRSLIDFLGCGAQTQDVESLLKQIAKTVIPNNLELFPQATTEPKKTKGERGRSFF
jgi:hypothetical protein